MIPEGVILLEHDGTLPFSAEDRVAIFGRAQAEYIKSGSGSAGRVQCPYILNFKDELKKRVCIDETVSAYFEHYIQNNPYDRANDWNFPASQKQPFLEESVENQNMSDLVYKGYTEEELRWLNDVAGNPENYLENEVVDYLFVLTDEDRSAKSNSLSKIWGTVNGTWKGSVTPNENQWATDVAAYRSSMAGVHTKYTSQFNIMKAKRTAEQE